MNFWETWTFADLLAEPVRNGIYKKKEFHGKGQKMINMGELFSYDFISNQEMKRIELNDRELANYLVKDGDLLFARRSFVLEGSGKCSLVVQPPEDTTFESSMIRARPNPDRANPRFYYYLFRSPQGRALISSIATRTAVSGIRGSELALLKVPTPPLSTQCKIAAILSAYDDLIENNTRRIEILEEMAGAIYREWYVEFRFPGHEGVEMVESELGLIPQGWKVKQLGDVTSVITKGTTPTTLGKKFTSEGINFIKVQSIDEQGDILDSKLAKIDDKTHELLKRSQLQENDILFSIAGAIGRVTNVPKRFLPANTNQALAIIRSSDLSVTSYLYRTLRSSEFLNYSLERVVQTAQANVSLSVLSAAPVIVPMKAVLDDFNKHLTPVTNLVDVLREKNTNLRQTRDLLLPKLISGEIDVSKVAIDTD